LCISCQGRDLYSHQKLIMYITGSHLRAVRDADDDDDDDDDNAGHHSATTRATNRQQVLRKFEKSRVAKFPLVSLQRDVPNSPPKLSLPFHDHHSIQYSHSSTDSTHHPKRHPDPFSRVATVHFPHRHTDRQMG